ncbi:MULTISPECIES: outer membrane beta-barrel protein [unclassified Fibrobacter]|jgi:hypothetical protein|uniref:outer membrane beta-barrel protein n=1 Tax=unclassified Fibrobacter TaxID=2634177 RepID=UPI000918B0FC|nr:MULTISPECIES: outer membrane beta-barrel protein [unclassified Fibrobacter]SHK41102.1 Outer membrane protein beta-barrel domain-containing protein [Fibrobacter sp. UWB12]SIN86236.1 Outer membrane protein beta-barrel domain-containing protein [Fibrobacter sp. UWB11]
MKKFLLAIAFLAGIVWAQPSDSDFAQWERSYYASLGFNVIANRGGLHHRHITIQDEDNYTETVNMPTAKILLSPDYNIGVNIREFTLALSFQYWTEETAIKDLPKEQDMRYMRIGAEFTYNFFYPERFQVGVGLGYSYTNLKIEKNTTSVKGFFDTNFMGSGVAIVTNMRYYLTENFGLMPSLRVFETWYKAVNTKNSGTVDIKNYIWQTYIAVSINAMVQF